MNFEEQYNLKIKLEEIFRPKIKRVFNRMLKDFKITLAARGTMIRSHNYLPEWTKELDDQYTRVQKSFLKIDKQEQEDEGINEELLLLALLTWRQENKVKQGRLISTTNRKQMTEAIDQARQELFLTGELPSNRDLALAATVILKKKFKGRVSSIALTETQSSAEATKFIGAEIKNKVNPTVLGGSGVIVTAKKKWVDKGDTLVRTSPFNHRTGGQTVQLLEPFIISGEFLNHPGDTSLGASIGNVAGCRCASEYL